MLIDNVVKVKVKNKPLLTFTNKELYSLLIKSKFCKAIAHLYWNNVLEKAIDWTSFYKSFKFKLLNNIFPSNSTTYQWGMIKSPNCHICNVVETYEHVFIDCSAVHSVWELMSELTLFSDTILVILNTFLLIFSILGFSIYKSYFLSDNRRDYCAVFGVKNEFHLCFFCFIKRSMYQIIVQIFLPKN